MDVRTVNEERVTSWCLGSEATDAGRQWRSVSYILGSMQCWVRIVNVAWTICVWSLVSAGADARISSVRAGHPSFATAQSSPLDSVLRFLAPESTTRQNTRRATGGQAISRPAAIRVSHPRGHPGQRLRALVQAGFHATRRTHVVRVVVPPSYLRWPYPPQPVPRYPGPLFAYAAPHAPTGYGSPYSPYSYGYPYGYRYPYVYYVVPWPRWPAGY